MNITVDRKVIEQALEALSRSDYLGWQLNIPIIKALRERLAQPEQEPVLETVYETIIRWDIGGGKRSRRELARRIVALYTTPPQRKPLPPQSPCEMTQAERKMFRLGWLECEAAHNIKE